MFQVRYRCKQTLCTGRWIHYLSTGKNAWYKEDSCSGYRQVSIRPENEVVIRYYERSE